MDETRRARRRPNPRSAARYASAIIRPCRLKGKARARPAWPDRRIFSNICFGKIVVSAIVVLMNGIEIGNGRTAAGGLGQARPRAYAGLGGRLWRGKGAAKAFSAKIGDNPLKSLNSRKKMDLVFVPKNLEFVPSGLDFVPAGFGFYSKRLGICSALHFGLEGRPRPGLFGPGGRELLGPRARRVALGIGLTPPSPARSPSVRAAPSAARPPPQRPPPAANRGGACRHAIRRASWRSRGRGPSPSCRWP
jgi:hypothetical protein